MPESAPPFAPEIAIVGDLHSAWDDADVRYFNGAGYELLLFVGDLGGTVLKDGLRIARSMSRLGMPALVLPGNNDVAHHAEFDAEFTLQRGLVDLMSDPDLAPRSALRSASGEVRTVGYSVHPWRVGDLDVTFVACRPFARGGDVLSFPEALAVFGIETMRESTARLMALVDAVPTEHVVLIAHNGPAGLGGSRSSPWGRDFHDDEGDWGDSDVAAAIVHARQTGRRVLSVIAGHMHHHLRGGGTRTWMTTQDGTLYVNPARVPRIFDSARGPVRHHVALQLTRDGARAEERLVLQEE
jgi:uncharacterized protein (TIGR04168 family)